MEIKEKNGATHYSDFEIDKALTNFERGISLETFFKHQAKRFEFGENEYFNMLIREVEIESQMYSSEQWEYYEIAFGIGLNEVEKIIIDLQKSFEKPPTPKPRTLTITGLFISPYSEKIDVLLEQLKNNGLIDQNNNWREWEKGRVDKNETAKFYYYLKQKKVLKEYDKTPALICFYDKFGIEVYKDLENPKKERCVCIKELTRSEKTDTKTKLSEKFDTVYSKWIETY